MNKSVNLVVFIGEVITPCRINYTKRKNLMWGETRFLLQTTYVEGKPHETYMDVIAFSKMAKALQIISKLGTLVMVSGQLTTFFATNKHGEKVFQNKVSAEHLEVVRWNKDGEFQPIAISNNAIHETYEQWEEVDYDDIENIEALEELDPANDE